MLYKCVIMRLLKRSCATKLQREKLNLPILVPCPISETNIKFQQKKQTHIKNRHILINKIIALQVHTCYVYTIYCRNLILRKSFFLFFKYFAKRYLLAELNDAFFLPEGEIKIMCISLSRNRTLNNRCTAFVVHIEQHIVST